MIAEILAWFLAVALHEFGHWLACKLNGWQPKIGFAVKGLKSGFCVKFTIPEEELENVNFESLWFKLSKVYLTALLFSLAPFYFGTCIHVIDPYAACIGNHAWLHDQNNIFKPIQKEGEKLSKVRFWDYVKFFLGNWFLALLATYLMGLVWILLNEQAFSMTQIMISAFGWCILFMLTDIWKEIKEDEKQNGE